MFLKKYLGSKTTAIVRTNSVDSLNQQQDLQLLNGGNFPIRNSAAMENTTTGNNSTGGGGAGFYQQPENRDVSSWSFT